MEWNEAINFLKCSESALYKMASQGIVQKDGMEIDNESINKLTGNAKEVYKVSEVAKMLGVSEQTIYNKIKDGELKSFKVGVGSGNKGGIRITDITATIKTRKSDKVIIKKIKSEDVEVIISIYGISDCCD